jgi:hypothetical protein
MGAIEAQHWWGEAPELGLIFATLPVSFYDNVYNANRLPSRGSGAMQLETGCCTRLVLGCWQVRARLGSESAQRVTTAAHAINLARRFSPFESLAPPMLGFDRAPSPIRRLALY